MYTIWDTYYPLFSWEVMDRRIDERNWNHVSEWMKTNINLIWNRQWSQKIEYIIMRMGEFYLYTTSFSQYLSRFIAHSNNKNVKYYLNTRNKCRVVKWHWLCKAVEILES